MSSKQVQNSKLRSVSSAVSVMSAREPCVGSAGSCLVQIVYSHRVKQFQEDSGGDPSALLIPALLDTKVRQSLLTSPASMASAGCLSRPTSALTAHWFLYQGH
jgi:hypothetical protein